MKTHVAIVYILLMALLLPTGSHLTAKRKKNPWKEWLREVDPIITAAERSVTRLLKTEEERQRFMESFWKARDPSPRTPVNEFRVEYQRRLYYAKNYLKGIRSDRGRIHVLLGAPTEKTNFIGSQNLVECELWSYEGIDKPGLFPYMALVFFRRHNVGDYQLYHPGIHKPTDLLGPQYYDKIRSNLKAFQEIKMNSSQLARASLSIIPSEGDPQTGMTMNSSNFALNRIYTLPEREVEAAYVRNFLSPTGTVEVSHSTNVVRGYGYIAVTYNKGLPLVHFALMPDRLTMKQVNKDLYSADIDLHINIEDDKGTIIWQNRRSIDLKVNTSKKRMIDRRRIVFRDFVPVIEGTHLVVATFINKNSGAFFTHKQNVTVSPEPGKDENTTGIDAVVGYRLREMPMDSYMPFMSGDFLVLTDPRFTFNQKEALEGILLAEGAPGAPAPEVRLENTHNPSLGASVQLLEVKPPKDREGAKLYKFRVPLTGVKDGTYRLMAANSSGDRQPVTPKLHILPYHIDVKHPFAMEKPAPATAAYNFWFILGRQYLALRQAGRAIKQFNNIPSRFLDGASLPVIAKAYYLEEKYSKVVELLERDGVKQDYPTLLMLANASIDLKRYDRALEYLEKIRKYGDTPQINQLLASTHLCLGNREKAMAFYKRARELKNNEINQDTEEIKEK